MANQEAIETRSKIKRYYKTGLLLILVALLILLLLALFLPVQKQEKKAAEKFLIGKPLPKGPGIVGRTKYEMVSARKTRSIGILRAPTKGMFIVVSFEVENLAAKPRVIDYSMFRLMDEAQNTYLISPDLTWSLYRSTGGKNPWGTRLYSGRPRLIKAVFQVARGVLGTFKLLCRDLDWRSVDYIELETKI